MNHQKEKAPWREVNLIIVPFTLFSQLWNNRYHGIRFRLVDIVCLGYLGLIGVLLPFFHREVSHWPVEFLIHLALVVSGLEIVRLGEKHPQNNILWTIRTFYPVFFYVYSFFELKRTVLMFFGTYWATDFLIKADEIIFGESPVKWVQGFYTPLLDEAISFFYVAYALFVVVVAVPLYIQGKRKETFAVLSIVGVVYFTNDFLFYLLPAENPRASAKLAELDFTDYTGYFFAFLTRLQGSEGIAPGGCFPSEHVSSVTAWSLAIWRYNRKLAGILFPIVVGVAISTVYLNYHHGVDAIAGIIWGGIGSYVAIPILRKRGEL